MRQVTLFLLSFLIVTFTERPVTGQNCQQICDAYIRAGTSDYGSGYSAGNITDLYNQCMACQSGGDGGGYQEQPRSACNPGFYVYGRYCVPNGDIVCPGGDGQRSCPSHLKCMSGGGCIPTEADDCGNSRYCSSGKVCVPSGYLGGELEDRCFTPDELASLRQAYEASEREKAEERERERQEAIAERKRKEEERKEAKRRKDEKEREAAKERSEARREAAERRKKAEETARSNANQQAVAKDRSAITTSTDPSSQVGSANSAAQILRGLRERSVLDRMKAGGSTSSPLGNMLSKQRRLVTRQPPAPIATPATGSASNAAAGPKVAPPPTVLQAPASGAATNSTQPTTSWVQDWVSGGASPGPMANTKVGSSTTGHKWDEHIRRSQVGPLSRNDERVRPITPRIARDVTNYGLIANDVYERSSVFKSDSPYKRVDQDSHAISGLFAATYIRGSDKAQPAEIVIAFRGTEKFDPRDWVSGNLSGALDSPGGQRDARQYVEADSYARKIREQYPNARIVVTGHSLGGSLASYVGNQMGVDTYTFDAARNGYSTIAGNNHQQINVFVTGDIVGDPQGYGGTSYLGVTAGTAGESHMS